MRRRLFYSFIACILMLIVFVQPIMLELGQTPEELRLAQFQKKRNKKIEGGAKFNGPDEYIKLQRDLRTAEDEKTPAYKPNYQFIEREKAVKRAEQFRKTNSSQRSQALNFVERGPSNVPGRTRGIWVDPSDATKNTFLAASASGGIWKTTNGGQSWISKTDNLPNLALTCLASSVSDANVIYAGSGEGFGNLDGVKGNGIFKSIDKGETWSQLPSTANLNEFAFVNRLTVDPASPDYVVAVTNFGIYLTEDGGSTWEEVYSGYIQDLRANPSDFNILYAAENGVGALKSVDKGQTWSISNDGMISSGRYEIAVSPVNPNRIFAAGDNATTSDLYISDDAGATWATVIQKNNATNVHWLGGQGWYDNTLEAHPFDANMVYAGGINQWRATIQDGQDTGPNSLLSLDISSVQSYMTFVNFGAEFFVGVLAKGANITNSNYVSVEFRFGPDQSQKAHRFTVPSNAGTGADGGAGVPANQYAYNDYVDVPFEAWDVTNNKQLMVSFRDQERDGQFNLEVENAAVPSKAREYLYVHTVEYNETTPSSAIAVAGGQEISQLYFMWPRLLNGATWDPNNLPDSKIFIKAGSTKIRYRNLENVTDGYAQFGGKNGNVHVDQHNIVPIVVDEGAKTFKLLIGNDGGVWSTATSTNPGFDNNTWSFTGNGYNTTQFYGIDKKPGSLEFIGGTQDNGTWKSSGASSGPSATYNFMIGGDGFEAIWNNLDPQQLIGGSQFNGFRRSANGGTTWSSATAGMTDAGEAGSPFISRLSNSKSNPDLIFAIGTTGVWRSTNFGQSWLASPLATSFTRSSTSNVEVSLAKSKVVWAFDGMSSTNKVHVSINGGVSFAATNNYAELTMGRMTGLATDPNDWKTAYALFSFSGRPKVLKTTDLGQNWTDISGYGAVGTVSTNGFPDVAVYSLFVMPHNPDMIWAGTEIGIVESLDGGQTWNLADYNIPAVSIWEIKQVDDQIIFATHGRGIWTVEVPELPTIAFDPVLSSATQSELANAINLQANLRSTYDSTVVYLNNERVYPFDANTTTGAASLEFPSTLTGTYNVILTGYLEGRPYESYPISIELKGIQAAELVEVSLSPLADKVIIKANFMAPYDSTVVEFDDVPVYSTVNNSSGATILEFPTLADDTYSVELVSYVGGVAYTSNALEFEVNKILSVPTVKSDRANLLPYPNPSNGQFSLELGKGSSEVATITVYTYLGKVVKRMIVPTASSSSNRVDITLDNINPGTYLIEADNGVKRRQAKIIVK